jgi:hypothetical protein
MANLAADNLGGLEGQVETRQKEARGRLPSPISSISSRPSS